MSGKKRVIYFCHLLANVRNLESFLPILDCFVFPLLHTRGWGGAHLYWQASAGVFQEIPGIAGTERQHKETMLLMPFMPIHPS